MMSMSVREDTVVTVSKITKMGEINLVDCVHTAEEFATALVALAIRR